MNRPVRLAALVLLVAGIAGAADVRNPYKRPSWRDFDRDCQNTREEVMLRTCRPIELSPDGCLIRRATCLDLYAGTEVSSDTPASVFEVDHILPASEAWKRRTWFDKDGKPCPETTRCEGFARFFNDERNLLVTRSRTNERKGDDMPDRWCPALRGARLLAARRFRETAARYEIPTSPAEEAGLRAWERGQCGAKARVL